MKELDEIMEGKHKINHLQIDGDTLAFNTELDNYTWNLSPRDIEIIIYCLQNEKDKYKIVLDKIKEYINDDTIFDGSAMCKNDLDIILEEINDK